MNGSFFDNAFGGNSLDLDKKNIYQDEFGDVFKLNKGKNVKLYASFPGSAMWQDKIFEGIIENSGKDYIVISDPSTGEWNLILFIYVNYISFLENINY